MKVLKGLIAVICGAAIIASPVFAAEKTDKTGKAAKKTCCEKAKDEGKDCKHKCCLTAHKNGKSCETCNPDKQDLKGNDKEKAGSSNSDEKKAAKADKKGAS